jgi:hypothetical protein
VAVTAIVGILLSQPGARILIMAPTNPAVSVIEGKLARVLSTIPRINGANVRVARIGASDQLEVTTSPFYKDNLSQRDAVVLATTDYVALTRRTTDMSFTHVFIDEASRISYLGLACLLKVAIRDMLVIMGGKRDFC